MSEIPSRVARQNLNIIHIKEQNILAKNNKLQIQYVQLDPNGLCNAKCWFCPVAYEGNPKEAKENMSLELMEHILKQIHEGRGDFVQSHLEVVIPFNFNEVLLYPQYEEMLQLMRKYGIKRCPVSTNGVALTKAKVDIMKKYPDVMSGLVLNIPSAFEDEWAMLTGFNPKLFNKVMENVRYAIDNLPHLIEKRKMGFMFNHVNEDSVNPETGWGQLLENAPPIDLDKENGSAARTKKKFAEMFPEIKVIEHHEVLDRLGFLERLSIFSNRPYVNREVKKEGGKIIGCYFDGDSQTENVLHINANGDLHLCCQDFNFESVYGNVKDKPLKELWHSVERRLAIKNAYKTFCQDCQYAVWE